MLIFPHIFMIIQDVVSRVIDGKKITYTICRKNNWNSKFADIAYREVEFDGMTSVDDTDHANFFFETSHICTVHPDNHHGQIIESWNFKTMRNNCYKRLSSS